MNRFIIRWDAAFRVWRVRDTERRRVDVGHFDTLAEAEAYVIERASRAER